MKGLTVFISHAKEDETLALVMKQFLEGIFLNGDFFVSGSDLGGGDVWVEELRSKLNESTAIVAILTPYSRENKWVYFEAGSGFCDRKTIPVVADGITFTTLPAPLNLLQGRSFDEKGLKLLTMDIAGLAGLREPVRFPGINDALLAANDFVSERLLEGQSQASRENTISGSTDGKDVEPDLNNKYHELQKRVHSTLVKAIVNTQSAFDVPKIEEMEQLKITELFALALEIGLTAPIGLLNIELMSIPLKSDVHWRKQNVRSSLERIEADLEKFNKLMFS